METRKQNKMPAKLIPYEYLCLSSSSETPDFRWNLLSKIIQILIIKLIQRPYLYYSNSKNPAKPETVIGFRLGLLVFFNEFISKQIIRGLVKLSIFGGTYFPK